MKTRGKRESREHKPDTFPDLPLFLLSCVSPFLIKIVAREVSNIGRTVGAFYAVSTIGSVCGTVLTGFVLIAHMEVSHIFLLVGCLLILLAGCYFLASLSAWVLASFPAGTNGGALRPTSSTLIPPW